MEQSPLGHGKEALDVKGTALCHRMIVYGASVLSSLRQHLEEPFQLSRLFL